MTFEMRTDRLRLVALSGPMTGEVLPLHSGEVTLGRDPASEICLADRSLSRTHCVLAQEGERWVIRDLGSANGTFVNGVQVRQQTLREGDQIRAGESVFLLFLKPYEPDPAGIEIIAATPSETTSRLRLEDAQYLLPAPPEHSANPRVEQHLRALLNFSNALGSIREEGELFEKVLDLVFEAIPADEGAVVLVDHQGELVGSHSRHGAVRASVPISRTVLAQVISERVGILSKDTSLSQSLRSNSNLAATGVRSLICVPLEADGRSIGALHLTAPESHGEAFDDDHLQLVTAVAAITSIALDNVRHLATVEREAERLRADLHVTHNLVGASGAMQDVYERVARVARSDTSAVIFGETGTGKELVARALHQNSHRARGPFIAINCAALTETLLETELFGHERGAFTGAVAQKKGKLEVADGGTLFLDEVSELTPAHQSKLLRVLQEREFERVGGTRAIHVNIRVISATNRRLAAEVVAGRFREDLLFRLNVVSIDIPPLRERADDIELLARHFLRHYAAKAGRVIRGISAPALQRLMTYPWPGNVRELENAIERAVVLGSSDVILPEDLPESLLEAPAAPGRELPRFHEAVIETKKRVIIEAFRQARRSYVEAARLLGLHPNYLHRVIRNLELKTQLESEP
jgi:Nif-specific regulatory protein